MTTEMVEEAVRRTRGRALLEASGGITLERIAELARAGVDAISVGALTYSVIAADIGLDFAPSGERASGSTRAAERA
jgi:nicotinate-nucleotide pyrophosphorylase (carboxylating)